MIILPEGPNRCQGGCARDCVCDVTTYQSGYCLTPRKREAWQRVVTRHNIDNKSPITARDRE